MADSRRDLAGEYNRWHAEQFRTPNQDVQLQSWHFAVERNLKVSAGASILEIGCGTGDFATVLAGTYPGSRITGVDFSESAISLARHRHRGTSPNLNFEIGDAMALPFASDAFDVIISCECLEHVSEPQRMAREVARLLRPNGTFYITTENYLNGMLLMWAKSLVTGHPIATGTGIQPHENFFLFWRVMKMLERAGLEVRHMESDYFQWLMLPRVSPSKLATLEFGTPFLKKFFRPFGRHFLFAGTLRTK